MGEPMKHFILQAATSENHVDALNKLLSAKKPERVIISTAFMSAAGISLIEDAAKSASQKLEIYVGIRNGITTAQALLAALSLGCKVYAVDTGSRTRIFHPKMYFTQGEKQSQIIIGSANLTMGGLNSNIEASLLETLDMNDATDANLVQQITDRFDAMVADFPKHVIPITKKKHVKALLKSGRVIDEADIRLPSAVGTSNDRDEDDIPKMKLRTKMLRGAVAKRRKASKSAVPKTNTGKPVKANSSGLDLMWESTPLTRRDLGIPIKATTARTGSMLWKKGNKAISVRRFFTC